MDLIKGVDANGEEKNIKVSMILLQAAYPGNDPIISLDHLTRNSADMSSKLLKVLSHMNMVMGKDYNVNVSREHAFSSGSRCAAKLCCEATLPCAVFKFARSHGVFNIHFGGMRIDVDSQQEMRLWEEYQEYVTRARTAHYEMVIQAVVEDLQNFRNAHKPLEKFQLDVYPGDSYRAVQHSIIDAQIEHVLDHTAADVSQMRRVQLMQWLNDLPRDDVYYYLRDGRPWARNTGVWISLNLDSFWPYDKRGNLLNYNGRPKLVQPVKMMSLLEIYLPARSESPDPLKRIWNDDTICVPDLDHLNSKHQVGSEVLMLLREAMYEKAIDCSQYFSISDQRHDDLMQLYGAKEHNIHAYMASANACAIGEQCRMMYSYLKISIKTTLLRMISGELLHWAMAARSLLDLKKQGKYNGQQWVDDHAKFTGFLTRRLDNSMLDETLVLSHFMVFQDLSLAMDLSFQNTATTDQLQYSQMANYSYQPKAWGFCIKVADMGHAVDVFKVTTKSRVRYGEVVTINTKMMGSGVDTMVDTFCQQNMVYGQVMLTNPDAKKFYQDPKSKCIVNSKISPLALATLNGSGIPVLAGGLIDDAASNHQSKAGLSMIRTEHMKTASFSDDSKSFLADMETHQNDSGRGIGTTSEGWQTTKGLENRTFVKMFNAPMMLVAGNRQDDALGAYNRLPRVFWTTRAFCW